MSEDNNKDIEDENLNEVNDSENEVFYNGTEEEDIDEIGVVYGGPVSGDDYDIFDPEWEIDPITGEPLIAVDIDADVYGPDPTVIYNPETDPLYPIVDPDDPTLVDITHIDVIENNPDNPEEPTVDVEHGPGEDVEPPVHDVPMNSLGWQLGEKGPIDFDGAIFTSREDELNVPDNSDDRVLPDDDICV